ncbi:MAG: alpha/beta hydrolase [Kiritimatiellae bacterium]|nr:alpha/beta hydrolase [Kiritimatiellia bacterium]
MTVFLYVLLALAVSTVHSENAAHHVFRVTSRALMTNTAVYPAGTVKICYRSAYDEKADWALFMPGDTNRNAVVYLHGSFSTGDQIFTRKDIRKHWLTRIQKGKHPLISINMRGTSYMSPAATKDLYDLLNYCRNKDNLGGIVLLGGSGGATSAMAYACIHPDTIDGVIAMGTCDIFARLEYAENSSLPLLRKLASTVYKAYGGSTKEKPEPYRQRSVLAHADRLNMPIILSMGEKDSSIPVNESRKIALAFKSNPRFQYIEILGGNHDSALWIDVDLETLRIR